MIDEDDNEDILPVEISNIVIQFLEHLKMQEEWADTEWLPDDFKKV